MNELFQVENVGAGVCTVWVLVTVAPLSQCLHHHFQSRASKSSLADVLLRNLYFIYVTHPLLCCFNVFIGELWSALL
jgi:hypothetical protein